MKRLILGFTFVSSVLLIVSSAAAQDAARLIQPAGSGQVSAAAERTPVQIDAYDATSSAASMTIVAPFRPTAMSMAEYRNMKSSMALQPASAKPGAGASPVQLHGILGATGYAGGIQTDNTSVGQPTWFPPDSGGAVGASHFVQALNNYLNVYSKAGVLLKHVSINGLMGSSCNTSNGAGCTFDPRVQYDPLWQRWVVTADSFDNGAGAQNFWIAVSKTSSATGGWYVYVVNTYTITGGTGVNFWDFPTLGMDQDGLIFTANVFSNSTGAYQGAWLFSLAKAQAYNGSGQSFHYFSGLSGTLQPPMVQKSDLNGNAWLAVATPTAAPYVKMYRLVDSSRPNTMSLFGPYSVAATVATSFPPLAAQTCGSGTNAIDSSDGRFVHAGTQIGDKYYQVQAIALGSFPAIHYYVISGLSALSPSVSEQGTFFATASSYDFNPSIAADSTGELVITWSATDPTNGFNSEVRYVGKQSGDPALSGAVGTSLISNSTCLTGNYDSNFGHQRWGDYSQVSVDPKTAKTFWINNEDIFNATTWGTEFGKVHF